LKIRVAISKTNIKNQNKHKNQQQNTGKKILKGKG
jgi:hypothetical protein